PTVSPGERPATARFRCALYRRALLGQAPCDRALHRLDPQHLPNAPPIANLRIRSRRGSAVLLQRRDDLINTPAALTHADQLPDKVRVLLLGRLQQPTQRTPQHP